MFCSKCLFYTKRRRICFNNPKFKTVLTTNLYPIKYVKILILKNICTFVQIFFERFFLHITENRWQVNSIIYEISERSVPIRPLPFPTFCQILEIFNIAVTI